MVLRPLLLSRLAPLLLLAGLGYLAAASVQRDDRMLAGLLVVALLPVGYFVVRAFGARVTCGPDTVAVHGYLRTRQVPRAAVVEVTGGPWPALRWRDGGAVRSTLLSPFAMASVSAPFVAAHNARSLRRLADCVGVTRSG